MTLLVSAVFTKSSGTPATGEALTDIAIYLYSRAKTGGTVATVWNGVNPTEEVGGGIYTRVYASDTPTTHDYFAYAVYSGLTTLDTNYSIYSGTGGATPEEIWATELPGSYASGTAGYIMSAIQNRIGGFTGSGVNTVLGFLKALMSKAASTPSDVGGTFSAATDSTEALRDHLTNAVSVSVTSVANGGTITLYNQADFSQAIALATAIAVGDQLYFSIKQRDTDTDDNALLRLSRTGGLLRVNKAAPTLAANGTITVDDATDGDITVAVEASELTGLAERSGLVWDVKRITAAGAVHNLATGDATIATAPTKAIT